MERVSRVKLSKEYGTHALNVLRDYLERDGGKGWFKVKKPLPTKDEFIKLREKHFATTVGDAISDSLAEFEELGGEVRDWYENLPESFQNGEKGDMLNTAADTLEGFSEPDVSPALGQLAFSHIPIDSKSTSRASRCSAACDRLASTIDFLNNLYDDRERESLTEDELDLKEQAESLASELDQIKDEGIEFPGMYG